MIGPNALIYGDNLDGLRRHIADESVDLVYLDPPFNSNANYNVLFGGKGGGCSAAQVQAFADTWHWDDAAARAYQETGEAGRSRRRESTDAARDVKATMACTAD